MSTIKKIGIIIQARLGSKRLPNKMLLNFHDGKGILEILIERLVAADLNIPIIVTTTKNKIDDPIIELGKKKKVKTFRGSEDDVLQRFIDTAEYFDLSNIIRICADNPFIDIIDLKKMIHNFRKSDSDYWCFYVGNKKPTILSHYGFWAEATTLKVLKKIQNETDEKIAHEHVTYYIYSHTEKFNIHFQPLSKKINKSKNIRLTIDTVRDFEIAKLVYKELVLQKLSFLAEDIIDFIDINNDWKESMKLEIMRNKK